jgi:hypothetical protein
MRPLKHWVPGVRGVTLGTVMDPEDLVSDLACRSVCRPSLGTFNGMIPNRYELDWWR